jgi:hypothetical protein
MQKTIHRQYNTQYGLLWLQSTRGGQNIEHTR